jgi:PAS domain S-box-containing protein
MNTDTPSILIIGNATGSLRKVSNALEMHGYRVAVALKSAQGRQFAQQLMPGLILLDTTTPGMDGLASCKALKTANTTREIPILCIIDPAAAPSAQACFEAGADDYLNQPLQLTEAMARIGVHLKLRVAQRQLQTCARQHRLLMDNHPDFIARFDIECRHVYVSPSILAYFNQPAEFFLGRTACELPLPGNPAQSQPLLDAMRQTIATGTVIRIETEWPTIDDIGRFEVHHIPEFDQHGAVTGVIGIARDITTRVRSESRTKLLEFALDQAHEAAYLIEYDSQPYIRYVNQEACRALGYSREELLSMTVFDIDPYFDPVSAINLRLALDTHGFTTLESAHKTRDGRIFPVELQLTKFIREGKATSIALARDISERKAAEEKIQRLTELYAALSQCNQAIVRCTDKDELFAQICRDAVHFGKMKMTWIGLLDTDTGKVLPVAYAGEGTEYLQDIQISVDADNPLGHGPTGTAIRENRPVWCQDFQKEKITAPWQKRSAPYSWGASASLPLHQDGIAIGAITVYAGQADAFDEAARNLLVEMAMDISYALDRFSSEARRRQMEQALLESERRYRDVFDNASDALFLLEVTEDYRFRNIEVNQAFERSTGIPRALLIGKYIDETVSPEITEAVNAKYRRCVTAGAPVDEELELDLPDGRRIYHSTLIPVHDENGRVYRIAGITRDITVSRQAEELLKKQLALETQLAQTAEVLPGVIYSFLLAPDGSMSMPYASARLEDVTGRPLDTAPIDGFPLVYPDDLPNHIDTIAESARTLKPWHNEFRIIHPVKGLIWLEGRSIPQQQKDGGILWHGFMHDISERKRMETALRESELQFRTLTENAPDHIIRYDLQCRRIYANPVVQKTVGLDLQQMIGKTPLQTNTIQADWRAYQDNIQRVIDSGQDCEMELSITDSQGDTNHYHTRFVAERGESGAIRAVLAMGRDITQIKRREIKENIRLRIFELLAQGAELQEVLALVVQYVEQSCAKFLGGIMLVAPDGKHLLSTCAPNLPEDYTSAVNGIVIGEGVGSCGTAVWRGETVIADDLSTHPYWAPYKHLALAAGLLSCWSEPIMDAAGNALGTFGVYQRQPASPTEDELALVRRACHLAAIAIERKRMETALLKSEQQFRTLTENSPSMIMRYDLDCRRIYVNPAYERKTGVSYNEAVGTMPAERWLDTLSIPADEYMTALRQVMTSGIATQILLEYRHPETADVTIHDFNLVPEYGPDDEIIGALAIGHNVTALKHAERELQESHALLSDLARHRETAREEERRHIARELHDELGQQLMALRLSVSLLNLRFDRLAPDMQEAINNLRERVDSIIQVTRNVSSTLRPPALDMGIVPALEWLTQEFSRHTGIPCEFKAPKGDICAQETQSMSLFRITQETLTNAARHAQASRVRITLDCGSCGCLLQVEDNGIGFDTELPRKQKSYGLIGLRERALAVGGELTVSSTPGSGTVVRVRIPTC